MKPSTSFLLGGLAGAVVGGLIAPRRGAETRRSLRERLAGAAADEPPHLTSPTGLAAEALRTGVAPALPGSRREADIPGDDDRLSFGDPEVEPLRTAYVGDEIPGGDMPTPDGDGVDDIGRAYGVAEEDSGALITSGELLEKRDRRKRKKGR